MTDDWYQFWLLAATAALYVMMVLAWSAAAATFADFDMDANIDRKLKWKMFFLIKVTYCINWLADFVQQVPTEGGHPLL